MAQVISYYAKHPVYEEGPFVCVLLRGKGENAGAPYNVDHWRIESEQKSEQNSVVPHESILTMLNVKRDYRNIVANCLPRTKTVCDWLNSQVKKGGIILSVSGRWVDKSYV